ncbi:MAG TPA: TonB-dependent receptor, partial [Ferruginibacter sp.]|nr:TonB-dependent receptor [Ferruginibacter sp.]
LAGVVNIITNVPLPENTFKAAASGNYQSNNNLRSYNFNAGANHNGLNWNIYTSNKYAADYRNKYDGRVFNSKFNEHNIGGFVGYNGNWGYSHVVVSNFNLKAGLVEGERDGSGHFTKPIPGGNSATVTDADLETTTPLIPYQHIRHFKIASDNSIKMGKDRLSFNVGYQDNQREEFGNPDDPNERSLFFDLKTITYTAQFHLPEKNGMKASIGLNGMQQNNENKGVEQLIPDYRLFDVGVYGYVQRVMKKITLSGGLRYDSRNVNAGDLLDGNTIKGNAFTKNFSNISGSLGLAAQVSEKLNLKFNIARGFRAPSIPELASNGAHEGTIRYEYGDNNLKSETSLQVDGGMDLNSEHLSLGVSAFFNSFNNFIFYRKLQSVTGGDSIINLNGTDLTAFKFDQRRAYLAGAEMTLDIHPHPLDWLHILNTFSMVSGRFQEAIEGSKNLPFIPAPKLVTEVKVSFPKLSKAVNNFYAKVELDNNFSQNKVFTAYNTETPTGAYTLLNGGIGADIVNKKKQTLFSLNFSAINFTDVAYQNHLSRLKYAPENLATGRTGVFNMGRNFSFKLNVPFEFKFRK